MSGHNLNPCLSNDQPEVSTRLYDRNFFFALLSQICFVIANTLMAHYARWIEFLGGGLQEVGWIMGISAALALTLRPWMAQWINRLGSRKMWLVGYCLFAVSSLSNCLVYDLGIAIYLTRSSLVLAAAVVFASGLTYITQTAPEERRTEAIGLLGAGGFIGMLVGPWLGDLILGTSSADVIARNRADFQTLFICAAVANVIPSLLLLMMRPPSEGSEAASARRAQSVRLREFVNITRRYWPGMILLVDLVFGVCMTAPFIFVASFIDQIPLVLGGRSVIGVFFAFYAGWAMIVRIGFRKLPDRVGPHRVLVFGMVCMTAGMFAYSAVDAQMPWMIALPAVITGTGHGLMFHTMTSLTIKPFPNEVRGTASALALMMLDLGMLAGAPILGVIGEHYGFRALFASIGIACGLVLVAYIVSLRRAQVQTGVGKPFTPEKP